MNANEYIADTLPQQTGKVVVVTGANSGLGLEAAQVLASLGAQVVMAVRSVEKGEQAAQTIRQSVPTGRIEVLPLDLASLDSIRRFAAVFSERYDALDILLNNAGIMRIPYRKSADGFEMQFATNHLGHFALTGHLLPQLVKRPGTRVVTVSSTLHRPGHIDFDDLNGEAHYNPGSAYSQSKLANLLFTYELQRQFEAHDIAALSVAAHPGYSATNLQFVGPDMQNSSLMRTFMAFGNRFFAQSVLMGTLPLLYAATMPDVQGGEYFGPAGPGEMRGYPRRVTSNAESYDTAVAQRLWEVSERLTGVHYEDIFADIARPAVGA